MNLRRLSSDLRAGRTTPSEVAARSLDRALQDESAGVWITLADSAALQEQAAELEHAGPKGKPLYGLPFAIKDNIDVTGMPTTAGCPAFAYVPERNAVVVQQLVDAGALPIGKTNLDQFATGLAGTRSPYGAPRSVFDPRFVSGGSSSGSAVAVAGGSVAFALGTDTAGSGRVPAALNGIVGLKPTRGLVSTTGVVPACRSLDCVSVFATDADGAATVLAQMASPAMIAAERRLGSLPCVAVPRPDQVDLGPGCRDAWSAAVDAASDLGLPVVEVDIEPLLQAADLLYNGPWLAERYDAVGQFIETHPDDVDPIVARLVLGGARWTQADRDAGRERLSRLARSATAIWEAADVLLLPTIPEPPTPEDVLAEPVASSARLGIYTNFVNLLDLAGIAVPAGIDGDGMTFGVSLLGPAGSDHLLIDLARRWPSAGGHVSDHVDIAVCGAHMSGLPLNHQLVSGGGRLLRTARTAPRYRLVALPGDPPRRPGLIRVEDDDQGASIDLEIWRLPPAAAGDLLKLIPAPLALGRVELADHSTVTGFVCEGYAAEGATDISDLGGWRGFLAQGAAS